MSTNSVQNKRTYKKKSTKKVTKKNSGLVALKKVNKLEKQMKKETEVKTIDTAFSMVPYAANAVTVPITYPAQGITQTTRVGNKISVIGVQFKGYITSQTQDSGSPLNARIRIGLVQNREGYDGGALTITEVYSATTLESTEFRNSNHTSKYKVLYDNHYCIIGSASQGSSASLMKNLPGIMYVEFYKQFKKPIVVSFSDTGATTAEDHQFYLFARSPDLQANGPTFAGTARIRYTDL